MPIRNRYHSEDGASRIVYDKVRPITMYTNRKMYMKQDDGVWICDKKQVKLMLIDVINEFGFFKSAENCIGMGGDVFGRKPSMRGIYGFVEARIGSGGYFHILGNDKYYDEKQKMVIPIPTADSAESLEDKCLSNDCKFALFHLLIDNYKSTLPVI